MTKPNQEPQEARWREMLKKAREVNIYCHGDDQANDGECSNLRTCYAHTAIAHAIVAAIRQAVAEERAAICAYLQDEIEHLPPLEHRTEAAVSHLYHLTQMRDWIGSRSKGGE